MKQVFTLFFVGFLLGACAQLPWLGKSRSDAGQTKTEQAAEPEAATVDVAPIPAGARTVEQFDTTTKEQKAAAVSTASSGGGIALGVTIASLGAASEPGFWLKTPLVGAPAKGRAVYAETGRSVELDLIPIDGPKTAGSRMSLAAMRLVGAPFTGLPEIRVYRLSQ